MAAQGLVVRQEPVADAERRFSSLLHQSSVASTYGSSVASTYGLIQIIPNGTTIEIISSVKVEGSGDS
jgi:hypothetical protein